MDFAAWIPAIALPSVDWLIVIGIFVLLLFDAIRAGTGRSAGIVFACGLSYLLYELLPTAIFFGPYVTSLEESVVQAAPFVILVALCYLFVRRIADSFNDFEGFLQAILASAAATITILVVWHTVPALLALWDFNSLINLLFGETYRFWWLIVALSMLAFASG